MTNIRRYFRPGQSYFLTHVTHNRSPILVEHIDLFWEAMNRIKADSPFEQIAWVILPDHFHILIDPLEYDLSTIIKRIKLSFSAGYRKRVGKRSGQVWQYRFWDHIIRDENDLHRHIDYIHYNPVKHGMVRDPFAWEHSSIHLFRQHGLYERDWGVKDQIDYEGDFGE